MDLSRTGSNIKLGLNLRLKWNFEGKFTSLGITFEAREIDMIGSNYTKQLKKAKKILNDWNYRHLTPIGRITVIKSLALSQLVHLFMALPNPSEDFLKNLQEEFFRFVWDKGREKISRNMMYQDKESGGLKMSNVKCFCNAMKGIWLKKLLDPTNFSQWKILLIDQINSSGHNLDLLWYTNHNAKILKNCNSFWKEVWNLWNDILLREINNRDPRTECIWYNPNIKIGQKMIYKRQWDNAGIRFINDLLTPNGQFQTLWGVGGK